MFSGMASTIDAAQTVMLETTSDNHCNPGNPHECPIPCENQVSLSAFASSPMPFEFAPVSRTVS
jgi:hypothetical protein